jgi:hypothetical protein
MGRSRPVCKASSWLYCDPPPAARLQGGCSPGHCPTPGSSCQPLFAIRSPAPPTLEDRPSRKGDDPVKFAPFDPAGTGGLLSEPDGEVKLLFRAQRCRSEGEHATPSAAGGERRYRFSRKDFLAPAAVHGQADAAAPGLRGPLPRSRISRGCGLLSWPSPCPPAPAAASPSLIEMPTSGKSRDTSTAEGPPDRPRPPSRRARVIRLRPPVVTGSR